MKLQRTFFGKLRISFEIEMNQPVNGIPKKLHLELIDHMKRGHKLMAVKTLKDETSMSLKEAYEKINEDYQQYYGKERS